MNYLVYLFYPALLALLLVGVKFSGPGKWNENVLSFKHTKAFLGFCAVLIMFHHLSQRVSAPWLNPRYIKHGLDFFVYLGYLCVAVFFFCSGYGMYTASRAKENFFSKFFVKRMLPVMIPAVTIWLVFFVIERIKKVRIAKPVWINTYDYIWYIPAILYLYFLFWLSFKVVQKEWTGILIMALGTAWYILLCFMFSPGSWWYNTVHLFLFGIIVAKNKEKILAFLQKGYVLWLILSLLITAAGYFWAGYYSLIPGIAEIPAVEALYYFTQIITQMVSAFSFVIFVLLLGMKIEIGNKVLAFLGGFTLELYLVHPLFVQLFGFAFLKDNVRPLYYIRNPFFYCLAVIALTIPVAFGIHKLVSLICGKKNPPKN